MMALSDRSLRSEGPARCESHILLGSSRVCRRFGSMRSRIRWFVAGVRHRLRPDTLRRKLFKLPVVRQADIVCGLRSLDIAEGDEVMLHSSLSSMGYVEGGAEAVIDALLETVGTNGTVLAPSFSAYSVRRGELGSWWAPQTTPVSTGAITEAFWRRPAAKRSFHPTHAVAAIGARAQFFTSEHGLDGDRYSFWGTGVFGSQSPWEKVVQEDVHYVMLGCTFEPSTLGHYVETCIVNTELAGLPRTEARGFANALRHEYYNKSGPWPDLNRVRLGTVLNKMGLVRHSRVGLAHLMNVRAAQYTHVATRLCREEPKKWLSTAYLVWRERVLQRQAEIQAIHESQAEV